MTDTLEKQDERFIIDDPNKADWALKQIQKAKREQKENAERVAKMNEDPQKEIDENNKWLETENAKLDESIEYFESLLNEFMNVNLQEDPKFKFKSPYGKISVSHRKIWTHDDGQLIKAFEGTEFVTNTPKLRWGDLKKQMKVVNGKAVLKETGELVDGVTVDETETINIKTEA